MPSTVFVDRKGTMRYMHHGYKPGDEGEYQNQVRALIERVSNGYEAEVASHRFAVLRGSLLAAALGARSAAATWSRG